jgi:pantoate kinase
MAEKATATAFSPAGISSFFEICDTTSSSEPITDLKKVGARGGGFGIKKGVKTTVSLSKAKINKIHVSINGRTTPEAETTKTVVEMLLEKANEKYTAVVRHNVQIPIGAGFGSSAAGALTTALALSKALSLKLTYNQLGKIAHIAEVKCKTGLGTVGPLMLGGCILTIEPGAPGIAVIDRIPISTDYVIVAGVHGSIPTREVLSSPERRLAVNKWGRITLDRILSEPSLENFLACCRDFAEKTGFMTNRVRTLIRLAEKAGAIGAAQNMVGEAAHALTTLENAEKLVQAFKQVLPQTKILVSQVDVQGARLLG